MYARPNSKETQDDLLRLQEQFNREKAENKVKPAATLSPTNIQKKEEVEAEPCTSGIQEQICNTFEDIPNNFSIGYIVENKLKAVQPKTLYFSKESGFPKPKKRDLNISSSGGGSIFAQGIKKLKIVEKTLPKKINNEIASSSSNILTGNDKDSIHEENVYKLSGMSQNEILEEKNQLLESMDPAIIAYLKSRHKKAPAKNSNPSIKEQNQAGEIMDFETNDTPNEVLNFENSDRWLNFSTVETNKLAWMKNTDAPKLNKTEAFEARFDFGGWLLPYSTPEMTEKTRTLYHHGEEPARPGYTLQELFQLSRSNINQQKITALNTIANILTLNSTGVYDSTLDLPLEQIFFVLRYNLDDNTPAILNASIKSMACLFSSRIDETCLDLLLGFGRGQIQPILALDHAHEDDATVNDQQLAETNLLKCLVRSNILTRIRYVLVTVRPQVETVVYCMELLTRLARDSHFILSKVVAEQELLRKVVEQFIGAEPLLQAVKFVRVLVSRSKRGVADGGVLMAALVRILGSEDFSRNTNGLKLQTECFHLVALLSHYEIGLETLGELSPVVMALLNYHYKNTDFALSTTFAKQGHVAALLILMGTVAKRKKLPGDFVKLIEACSDKWLKQFCAEKEFSCGKLQIVASVFFCLNALANESLTQNITDVINSKLFTIVTNTLKNGSMLLNNYESHKVSSNLKTLGAAAWHTSEHVIPLLQSNSPIPFLSTASDFILTSKNQKLKLALLRHQNISDYINSLRSSSGYHLITNWFTRTEANFIINILKISVQIKESLEDTQAFYEVAVKCLSIFVEDQKKDIEFILENIIFSPKFYPSDVLMANLTIETRSQPIATSLDNLSEILEVYVQVLGLKQNIPDFTEHVALDCEIGSVIPVDWIYTPIIGLYSEQQQNRCDTRESQQVHVIRNCLRWVLIYETYFPDLARDINATDRFCRVACVFLGSDSLFLIPEIHDLLQLCLINIVKCEKSINFDREIQGLSNFQDFYTQLLEQYQGVSYGDVLFGNFILLPLAQRHNTKWRKTLWSEYLGAVETFNVTKEQCLCPIEGFETPHEEDISLLKCYRRAVAAGAVRQHSILYYIAKFHIEQFVRLTKLQKQ